MKLKSIGILICALNLLSVAPLPAQNSSPDPQAGAEMTGTIKEYTPGVSIVLEMLPPTPPVTLKLARTVGYVDTDGKTVEAPGLTTNQKVRVHYRKIGGENVADKVTLIGN